MSSTVLERQPAAVTGPASAPASAAPAQPRRLVRDVLPPAIVLGIVLAIWYGISYLVLAPRRRFLLPPPHRVISEGFLDSRSRQQLLDGLVNSARVAVIGLAIAITFGTLLAVIMSQARWLERSLYPWAVVLQTIPVLALVPLIGFWFSYGFSSRVLVCVLIALFPIVTTTLFGLRSADRAHRDLFRLERSSRFQRLVKLELPGALPSMLTGWRTSAGLSVIGAIVGDFFFRQGPPGMGRLLDNYNSNLQSSQLFAAVVLSSLLGLSVFWTFGLFTKWLVGSWHESAAKERT